MPSSKPRTCWLPPRILKVGLFGSGTRALFLVTWNNAPVSDRPPTSHFVPTSYFSFFSGARSAVEAARDSDSAEGLNEVPQEKYTLPFGAGLKTSPARPLTTESLRWK